MKLEDFANTFEIEGESCWQRPEDGRLYVFVDITGLESGNSTKEMQDFGDIKEVKAFWSGMSLMHDNGGPDYEDITPEQYFADLKEEF